MDRLTRFPLAAHAPQACPKLLRFYEFLSECPLTTPTKQTARPFEAELGEEPAIEACLKAAEIGVLGPFVDAEDWIGF